MSKENIPPQQLSRDTPRPNDPLGGELRSQVRRKPLIEKIQDFLRQQKILKKDDPNPHKDPFRDELL